MATHERLLKQLTKALGVTGRYGTGVNFGRSYRSFRGRARGSGIKGRIYFQDPHTRKRNALKGALDRLLDRAMQASRYRLAPYKRAPYRGRYAGRIRSDAQRARERRYRR